MSTETLNRELAAHLAERPPPEWLGTTEAAAWLGVTARTLYRLIDMGDLVAFMIGRVLRIRRADLEAYLESAKVRPGTLGHLVPDSGE